MCYDFVGIWDLKLCAGNVSFWSWDCLLSKKLNREKGKIILGLQDDFKKRLKLFLWIPTLFYKKKTLFYHSKLMRNEKKMISLLLYHKLGERCEMDLGLSWGCWVGTQIEALSGSILPLNFHCLMHDLKLHRIKLFVCKRE